MTSDIRTHTRSELGDRLKQVKYDLWDFPRYVMGHPFKGFSDVKLEGQGKVWVGAVILMVQALLSIIEYFYNGFIINFNDVYEANILLTFAASAAPYLLFMVGNWSITTLMDGSGSMRDIFIVVTYAQYLMIPCRILALILSNILVEDELAMATFFVTLSFVLLAVYAFIGLLVVHDFGLLKGLASVVLTVLAVMIILFIAMLLITLAGEVVMFLQTVWRELMLKLS